VGLIVVPIKEALALARNKNRMKCLLIGILRNAFYQSWGIVTILLGNQHLRLMEEADLTESKAYRDAN
jgi:hypothetical protein